MDFDFMKYVQENIIFIFLNTTLIIFTIIAFITESEVTRFFTTAIAFSCGIAGIYIEYK